VTEKPNINAIRAHLTAARPGYSQQAYADIQSISSNTLLLIEWAESLEAQLAGCANDYRRLEAERDSIRQAHASLASSAEQAAVAELQAESAALRSAIDERDRDYAGLQEASSDAVAAVNRVTALLDEAEHRQTDELNAKPRKKTDKPTFLLSSAVRAAVEGP
jgi:chromosome segregation ATPase